jgi:hypothetical protein
MNIDVRKICATCKDPWPLTYYGKSKASKDGHKSQCKSCVKKYNKKYKSEYHGGKGE